MKAKGLKIVAAVFVLTFLMVSTSYAFAISAWVNRVRTTDGTVDVMLRYQSGTGCTWTGNVWFDGTANMDDQALAVALTAISLGKTVRIQTNTCVSPAVFVSIGLDE